MGLSVFLSWALARELHPDAPMAAFVAVGLSSIALWFWPYPDLQLLFFILLILRLINRSTGIPARIPDLVLMICYTAWLLYGGQLIAGILATAAFWSNSKAPEPQAAHKYAALLTGLLTILAIAQDPFQTWPGSISISTNIIIIALSTAFALFIRTVKEVKSRTDATDTPLHLHRLRSAQAIVLLAVAVFSLWHGDTFFSRLSPIWASFGGIFLYAAFQPIRSQKQKNKL